MHSVKEIATQKSSTVNIVQYSVNIKQVLVRIPAGKSKALQH